MASDVLVSRELKSLQDELAAGKIARAERGGAGASSYAGPAGSAAQSQEAPADEELQPYLRQLADEVTELFGKAETNIAAHPAQSVAAALLVGILIGRMLGRR